MRSVVSVVLATFSSILAAAHAAEAPSNVIKDAGTSSSHHQFVNIVLAGLAHDANRMSPNVFDFLVEMSCEHDVKVQILATEDFELFQAEYNGARKNGYAGIDCAPLDILYSPMTSNVEGSTIGIIEDMELREYQKNIIRDELRGSSNEFENSIIVVADLELGELPRPRDIIHHANAMASGRVHVDALCSNGMFGYGDNADQYYDIFSTVLFPDTFVCPIEWRSNAKAWPDEDPSFILSSSDEDKENEKDSFSSADLFRWFQQQGKRDNSMSIDAVPVRSCFGGLAVYKANKYLDTRCSYSHGRKDENISAKYQSSNNRISEHLLWSKCMTSIDPDFTIAVQPDMVTKYENLLGENRNHLDIWRKRSLLSTPSYSPTESPTKSPTKSPTTSPTTTPSTISAPTPTELPPCIAPSGPNRNLSSSSDTMSGRTLTFNNTKLVKRRVNAYSNDFTMETIRNDQTTRPWCLDVYDCQSSGCRVGLRLCQDGKLSQVFKQDSLLQLYLAIQLNLCMAVDSNFEVYITDCSSRYSCNPTGIRRWETDGGQLVALGDNGERFPAALQPGNEMGPLIVVPDGDPSALPFDRVPVVYDGLFIQSDNDFGDATGIPWCLQAINMRNNANLNVRRCEGRTKQQWLFDKGKLRLALRPELCVINVRGKILKMGSCDDSNLATFSFDYDKGIGLNGGVLGLKRGTEKFYIGFDNNKYDKIRLITDASPLVSPTLWRLEGVPSPLPPCVVSGNSDRKLLTSSQASSTLTFNSTQLIKRRVNAYSNEFTMETIRNDRTSRPWCLDVYDCQTSGCRVGLRTCENGKLSQIFKEDALLQLYLAIQLNLCLSVDYNFEIFITDCSSRYECHPAGIRRWETTEGQLVALGDNGERFPAALQPGNEEGPLIVVSEDDPLALNFTRKDFSGLLPCVAPPPRKNRNLISSSSSTTSSSTSSSFPSTEISGSSSSTFSSTQTPPIIDHDTRFVKRRVNAYSDDFTMQTVRDRQTSTPWCLDVFNCQKVGCEVGLRLCETGKSSQIFRQDRLLQLYLAIQFNLCLSVRAEFDGDVNAIYTTQCSTRYSCNPFGIKRWETDKGQLVALGDNGERFPAALNPRDEMGALIVVPDGDPRALAFEKKPVNYDAQLIQSSFNFKNDATGIPWCLQAINKRKNAYLNVRPCEDRTKQKWEFIDGKIRMVLLPQFCIHNVIGKVLRIGLCTDTDRNNLVEFSYDEEKGGILAVKKKDGAKFYIGFTWNYDRLRLFTEASANASTSLWSLQGTFA